jgi:hypothetical protein
MTIFTAARMSNSSVENVGVLSQFEVHHVQSMRTEFNEESNAQLIFKRIDAATQSLQSTEFIKRLIKSYQFLERAHLKRNESLDHYMGSLRSEATSIHDSDFTIFLIDYSWKIWQELSKVSSKRGFYLSVPDACPGQNNNFMYTWSKDEHYLECEVFGSGEVEFFYKNRETNDVWGEDTVLEEGFSSNILDKVALFAEVGI